MLEMILALLVAFMTAVSSIMQKIGLKENRHMFFSKKWIAGTIILIASFFVYVMSLDYGPLIIVQAVLNSTILFIILLEIVFFKSKIKNYEIISLALFLIGMLLIQVKL